MNKQELIEKFEQFSGHGSRCYIERNEILNLVKQLDEPQPVKVPQFVADYIEESRLKGWDLLASMCFVVSAKNKKTTKWFYLGENKNIFALAWIFGCEVEKEKRYTVRIKGVVEDSAYLKHQLQNNHWYYGSLTECSLFSPYHTKKELEEAGFGWVFDCEGIEIEEVE